MAAVAVLLFLRLPFLSNALDNIDSVNFDLGVHDYDPGRFQPHPPGFAVYIAVAKTVHGLFESHAAGLAVVSALLGALSVIPLYWLMRALLVEWIAPAWGAVLACLLTLFNPTLWFNSVRPMSDLTGFFFITTAQCLLLTSVVSGEAWAPRRRLLWLAGVAAAGLSTGVRVQAIWCVGPLLLYGMWRLRSLRVASVLLFGAVVLAWLVPTVALSGGATRYAQGFSSMLGEALPGEPIFGGLTLNRAAARALDVFLTPWQDPRLGLPVLLLAAGGALVLATSHRRLLALVVLLFGPYAVYHYVLQETLAIRYAIPIVPAVSLLASVAVTRAGQAVRLVRPAAAIAALVASALVTFPALSAYHSASSPSQRALATIERLENPQEVVVSGHRMFERYLMASRAPAVMLPNQGAWRTLTEYWKQGGRKPVLFLRDPRRITMQLFGRDGQESLGSWAWPARVKPFLKGEYPGDVELVRLTPPRWLTESGLLVSPEAGPLEKVTSEPPVFYVRKLPSQRRALLVSGTLQAKGSARLALTIGKKRQHEWNVGEHFAIHTVIDPVSDPAPYVPLSLETSAPAVFTDVWLEPEGRPFIRLSDGVSPPERDEVTRLFRWIGPRATAAAYLPRSRGRLTIEGAIPLAYFAAPFTLALEWNGHSLGSVHITTPSFRIERDVHGSADQPWSELTLRSSQSFVPHVLQKNGDRRSLSVRVYRLALE